MVRPQLRPYQRQSRDVTVQDEEIEMLAHNMNREDDDAEPENPESNPLMVSGDGERKAAPKTKAGPHTIHLKLPTWSPTQTTWMKNNLSGWRGGVAMNIILVAVVLLLNTTFLLVTITKHGSREGSVGTLVEGACSYVETLALVSHLFINILSTLLLSASNYTMQILAAPTRQEVDAAHGKSRYVRIGIQDLGNFRYVSLSRVFLWLLLGLSSLPLHLMYNSAIFPRLGTSEYAVAVVTPSFLSGEKFGSPYIVTLPSNSSSQYFLDTGTILNGTQHPNFISDWNHELPKGDLDLVGHLQTQATQGTFMRKSQTDCIEAYSNPVQSEFRNVIAVSEAATNGSLLWLEKSTPLSNVSTAWICKYSWKGLNSTTMEPVCTSGEAENNATYWSIGYHHQVPINATHSSLWSYPISYCLVEPGLSKPCALNYDSWLLSVVIGANAVKIILMVVTLTFFRRPTIVTLGDGVSSFLENPDVSTQGMSLFTEKDFRGDYYRSTNATREPWAPKAKTYAADNYHVRNFSSPSELEWFISLAIYFFFVLGSAIKIMLSSGVSATDFRNLALSTIRPQSLTMGRHLPTPALAIVANSPQILLSLAYMLYNRLITAVALAREWSSFATTARKALRTTRPVGEQRSTYWLQIPYRFALPMVAASALLHYLASQALFFAKIRVYAAAGERVVEDVSGLGTSNAAMLGLAVCASALIATSMVLGFRVRRAGLPPASFCSAVVAAACHRPEWDEKAHEKAVRWGEVVGLRFVNEEGADVGHCCFSSGEVTVPEEGRKYM